ncbi:ribose-5-phosphate isomerase [Streptomonospora litoralis]|uniref:D-erythrulose 4-phosphate isomerase n=1 Tax=Streptomonospora litoralis TaxID=2498135 RepID=A0A4P6Q426_9ACTN|nr:ribose-5-phosphate isomerase [Streptomonospora litoralis]QBI54051.1 Putative sugar phosphate isomerase YwlF [Streptomonospora litoralis]
MRIAVAADSAGVALKDELRELLRTDTRITEVSDLGVPDAADDRAYPLLGIAAAEEVAAGRADRAVLVCGTGIGMCISANKVAGVRATVAHDSYSAERSIKSNDCQVLTMGARVIGPELAKRIVAEWIGHAFDPASASAAKVARISEYERT